MTSKPSSRKGIPNKRPSRGWVYDQLVEREFDFLDEFTKLYEKADDQKKFHMLIAISEYCLPKQRPVDTSGDTAPPGVIDVTPQLSDEQLLRLVATARGAKPDESA